MDSEDSVCPRCGYEHKSRAELIRKLVETNHLNVPERRELVPSTIQFLEVVGVIRDAIERQGCFLNLEKLEGGKYRVHHLLDNELAMSVYGPAVDVIHDYLDLDAAVQAFLNRSDIEGIKILGVPAKPQAEVTIRCSLFGNPSPGLAPEAAAAAPTPSDHKIIPGDRIGPLRLAGTIDEIVGLLGPSPQKVPWHSPGSVLQTWVIMGVGVAYDRGTGKVLEISIGNTRFGPWPEYWSSYLTPEGVCLGSKKREIISRMGGPERTVSSGGARSLDYDGRGIRFTVLGWWPFTQKVGAIRIAWPAGSV
jgi:hypothetical protein